METLVYKILTRQQWETARKSGHFAGSPADLADGYIHFSTLAQLLETAQKHFAGQSGLMLLAVRTQGLADALKYEAARGGQLFPHLYGVLSTSSVATAWALEEGPGGVHRFPPEIGLEPV